MRSRASATPTPAPGERSARLRRRSWRPRASRFRVVIHSATAAALGQALQAAQRIYEDPPAWRQLQLRGMALRHAWPESARRYVALYRTAIAAANRQTRPDSRLSYEPNRAPPTAPLPRSS